jgi:hypothetical protein
MERFPSSNASLNNASSSKPLSSNFRPPAVVTTITAVGGRIRYRVYAYRALGHPEAIDVVRLGLRLGWIAEPPIGAEAVLYTSIGASGTSRRLSSRAATPAAD